MRLAHEQASEVADHVKAMRITSAVPVRLPLQPVCGDSLLLGSTRVAADRLDDVAVGEGGDVAKRATFGYVSKESAHDLPGARLGEVWNEEEELRSGDRADLFRHMRAELRGERL